MSRRPVHLGYEADQPLILGVENGAAARLVEGTGLFLAVRKGDRRWVTGDAVNKGLRQGVLIAVYTGDEPAVEVDEIHVSTESVVPEPVNTAPADADLAALHREHEAVLQGAEPKLAAAPAKKAPAKKAAAKKAPAKKS